ncbi:MAG: RNA repair domain-containing protein [archaeon]
MHPLKNVLNKLFWDRRENAKDYRITFVHRGAPEDKRTISASQILEVGNSYFVYMSSAEGEATIPFHRVVEVFSIVSDKALWRSTKQESE